MLSAEDLSAQGKVTVPEVSPLHLALSEALVNGASPCLGLEVTLPSLGRDKEGHRVTAAALVTGRSQILSSQDFTAFFRGIRILRTLTAGATWKDR